MNQHSFSQFVDRFKKSVSERIYWQEGLLEAYIIALLSWGHLLLVWPPGVAKTKSANIAAETLWLAFKRMQFTSDLLPSDILWAEIYDPKNREFKLKKGPIFANFVLADELNRAPPKVQSALLECMQEGQVTISDQTLRLDQPFFVVATMNPYDGVGTYTLPDAILDRFLISFELGYPTQELEAQILASSENDQTTDRICTSEEILEWGKECREGTFVDEKIYRYIARLIAHVRGLSGDRLMGGVSTRAALALSSASKIHARIRGRDYVIPEDVKEMFPLVIAHRVRMSFASSTSGDSIDTCIHDILDSVPVEWPVV